MLYHNKTKIIPTTVSSGKHHYRISKKFVKPIWKPPLMEWLRWDTDASKIANKSSSSISLMCKDNKSRSVTSLDKKIGDVPILVRKQS